VKGFYIDLLINELGHGEKKSLDEVEENYLLVRPIQSFQYSDTILGKRGDVRAQTKK
jgi:hypothetical protein